MAFGIETAAGNVETGARVEAVTTDVSSTTEDVDLVFYTMLGGATATEAMRVHDDGNLTNEIDKSDIILVGVSRTSKTPTSIYLANKGFRISNIPLVNENSLPEKLKKDPHFTCVVGLSTEPERLADLRKNRMNSLKEKENTEYTNLDNIKDEVLKAKKTFQKYKWPVIDVTRKSVEETAASIIKIHEIYSNNVK